MKVILKTLNSPDIIIHLNKNDLIADINASDEAGNLPPVSAMRLICNEKKIYPWQRISEIMTSKDLQKQELAIRYLYPTPRTKSEILTANATRIEILCCIPSASSIHLSLEDKQIGSYCVWYNRSGNFYNLYLACVMQQSCVRLFQVAQSCTLDKMKSYFNNYTLNAAVNALTKDKVNLVFQVDLTRVPSLFDITSYNIRKNLQRYPMTFLKLLPKEIMHEARINSLASRSSRLGGKRT